ncbi:MAG: hypothetical protein WCQ99_06910 [Pseudomonadota bacterium]
MEDFIKEFQEAKKSVVENKKEDKTADDFMEDYEESKKTVLLKKTRKPSRPRHDDFDDFDDPRLDRYGRKVAVSDVLQVGTKIVIGGGVGLLAGVTVIALAASAAEVVVAGVVTKIAGLVGGAMGLNLGLSKFKKEAKKNRALE